jgi:Bacterial Ig-like domain (group 3)
LDRRTRRLGVALTAAALFAAVVSYLAGTATSADAAGDALTMSPATIDFGTQFVGTVSAWQTITVTNNTANVVALGFRAPSAASGFDTDLNSSCVVSGIAPHGSCIFRVRFTPVFVGPNTQTLTATGAGETHSTTLFGTGIAPTAGVTTSPSSVALGQVIYGQQSAPATILISNTGNSDEHVSAILQTPYLADWSTSGCGDITLQPSQTCTATVAFTGGDIGHRSATLVATASLSCGCASPVTASTRITATGVPAVQITAAPASALFGQPVTFTATETPNVQGYVPETMSFTVDGVMLGSPVPLRPDGTATSIPVELPAGSHVVDATFHFGDVYPAGSGQLLYDVGQAISTVTVAVEPPHPTTAQAITYTATISPPATDGHVTFFVDGAPIGQPVPTTIATSQVSIAGGRLPAGDHTVQAVYAAESGNASGGSSRVVPFVVTQGSEGSPTPTPTPTSVAPAPRPSPTTQASPPGPSAHRSDRSTSGRAGSAPGLAGTGGDSQRVATIGALLLCAGVLVSCCAAGQRRRDSPNGERDLRRNRP